MMVARSVATTAPTAIALGFNGSEFLRFGMTATPAVDMLD
jgi:hypothetical protein